MENRLGNRNVGGAFGGVRRGQGKKVVKVME